MNFLVQASSVSWSGGPDLCMNLVNGHPVVYWTIKKIYDNFEDAIVTVIAPKFDENGKLDGLKEYFRSKSFDIFYGNDASPLKRMISVTSSLKAESHVARIDGLHMWFDVVALKTMFGMAKAKRFDCIKFPDDFPVQFTSEVYSVKGLRGIEKYLVGISNLDVDKHYVHSRFILMRTPGFMTEYLKELPFYSDEFLQKCRSEAKDIYRNPRLDVNGARIVAGDQLSHHYKLAEPHLKSGDKVLDIASGVGFGGASIASKVKHVICADIDNDTLREGEKRYSHINNIEFSLQNVIATEFLDNHFDVVLSMETIEHIEDTAAYCKEISRVVRSGGLLILSTPQNSLGHIPVNPEHVREYSVQQLLELMSQYFDVEIVMGLKSGTITFQGDSYGSNTFIVAKNTKKN